MARPVVQASGRLLRARGRGVMLGAGRRCLSITPVVVVVVVVVGGCNISLSLP